MLSISPPTPSDVDDLLNFELINRTYFEARINARPSTYYSRNGVAEAIDKAAQDADRDVAYQYLVRSGNGLIIGRANLSRVRREHFHSAEMGYRVGEAYTGRGVAKQAVALVMAKAFGDLALARVEATARPENIGSTRVLLANGFTQFGRSTKSFQLGTEWYDLLHFERHAGASPREV